MFQFPSFAPTGLFYSAEGIPGLPGMGFPIRKSPDHSLFAAPRSLSQLVTSFIAV